MYNEKVIPLRHYETTKETFQLLFLKAVKLKQNEKDGKKSFKDQDVTAWGGELVSLTTKHKIKVKSDIVDKI